MQAVGDWSSDWQISRLQCATPGHCRPARRLAVALAMSPEHNLDLHQCCIAADAASAAGGRSGLRHDDATSAFNAGHSSWVSEQHSAVTSINFSMQDGCSAGPNAPSYKPYSQARPCDRQCRSL